MLSPTLLTYGSATSVAFDAITAAIGIYLATCGMIGYFRNPLGMPARIAACAGGLAAIVPDSHFGFVTPGFLSISATLCGDL